MNSIKKDMTLRQKLIALFTFIEAGAALVFLLTLVTLEFTGAKYAKLLTELGYDANKVQQMKMNVHWNVFILLIVAVVIFVIAEINIVKCIRHLRLSITELKTAVDRTAQGEVDIEITVNKKDEIGQLAESTATMIEMMKKQADAAKKVAEGDLTVNVIPRSDKDVLNVALKQMVASNNEALLEMRTAASQVSDGSDQVAAASQALAQGSTEQASAITQITASIEDIAHRTRVNADDANNANNLVITAKDDATRGNERMNDMIQAMADINESSESISKIIKVIDDIAFQTNILALNAAVEAARAGAHGKGFGVVAEEVRNLAGKSAQAASETAELIENSIHKVDRGSKLAEETAAALKEIMNAIDQVASITGAIAEASNEQATAVEQIDQAIGQVSIVVQNNSSTSEECAAASEELSAQALKLTEMINRYKLNDKSESAQPYSKPAAKRERPKREKTPKAAAALIEQKDDELVISLDDGFGKY